MFFNVFFYLPTIGLTTNGGTVFFIFFSHEVFYQEKKGLGFFILEKVNTDNAIRYLTYKKMRVNLTVIQ